MTMTNKMKGISCCGDCVYYDWKKHRCKRGFVVETNPENSFFDDCALPDVQPVVHGYWKEEAYMREYDPRVTCTYCGETYGVGGWTVSRFRSEMNFCPNCGAKMDLGDDT
jgi:hypothetical protein